MSSSGFLGGLRFLEDLPDCGLFPFGPPPEEYHYRCSHCRYEMKVNEAIIDAEIAKAEFEGRNVEGFMPLLGCPRCNREAMEYAEGRKPAR